MTPQERADLKIDAPPGDGGVVMSKWCGDENCLQCADKEPDPYVHLPRADYDALREQNRVLREALSKVCLELECSNNPTFIQMAFWLRDKLKAALTATSQPAKPQGKMHACDIPGCVSCGNPEDATSQEPTA